MRGVKVGGVRSERWGKVVGPIGSFFLFRFTLLVCFPAVRLLRLLCPVPQARSPRVIVRRQLRSTKRVCVCVCVCCETVSRLAPPRTRTSSTMPESPTFYYIYYLFFWVFLVENVTPPLSGCRPNACVSPFSVGDADAEMEIRKGAERFRRFATADATGARLCTDVLGSGMMT